MTQGLSGERNKSPASLPPVEGNQTEYENAVATATCLKERGWDVELDSFGGWGIVADVPEAQSNLYNEDYSSCVDGLGILNFVGTEQGAKLAYDNLIRVHACLDREGYSVETVPSRESYVAKALEDPAGESWNPYSLVASDDLTTALRICQP
ncbi:hypothetical protein D1871_19635 [Nakamurella silvestris]|nr:hypothetical protein D1871_19635 [Nakamurella silvestris]